MAKNQLKATVEFDVKFKGNADETLIAFESGHYKKVRGKWKGDSVWCHFEKPGGGMIHVNKDKVEYMETFPCKRAIPSVPDK